MWVNILNEQPNTQDLINLKIIFPNYIYSSRKEYFCKFSGIVRYFPKIGNYDFKPYAAVTMCKYDIKSKGYDNFYLHLEISEDPKKINTLCKWEYAEDELITLL